MHLDHVGIVVRSIETALPHWSELFGYRPVTEVVVNSRQKVKVVFLGKDQSLPVKLVEPLDATSPAAAYAARGGGVHHLCFMCESVASETERLRAAGARVLTPPQPGEAFDNESIAFVSVGPGLLVELIDTEKRARQIHAPSST